MPSAVIDLFYIFVTAASSHCHTVHTVAVNHFHTVTLYVGRHSVHIGLVYDVVDAVTVDTRLEIITNTCYETNYQNMSHTAIRETVVHVCQLLAH